MRRAVANNFRTKITFNPSSSENETQIPGMFQGLSKDQLKALGKYRVGIQKPSKESHNNAILFDTYPLWEPEDTDVDTLKNRELLPPPMAEHRSNTYPHKSKFGG